jgi:hypothetical protein
VRDLVQHVDVEWFRADFLLSHGVPTVCKLY